MTLSCVESLETNVLTLEERLKVSNSELLQSNEKNVEYESNNEQLTKLNNELNLKLTSISEEKVKIEESLIVKSETQTHQNNDDIQTKLDQVQQQNHKLKVKLKQLMEKNKVKHSDETNGISKPDESEQIIASKNSELESLHNHILSLTDEIQTFKSEKQQFLIQIANLEEAIRHQQNEIDSLQVDKSKSLDQTAQLAKELQNSENTLVSLREEHKLYLKAVEDKYVQEITLCQQQTEINLNNCDLELRAMIEMKQNEIVNLREDTEHSLKLCEKKYLDEISLKDEQIQQLAEDLRCSQESIQQLRNEHELNLKSVEEKYLEQICLAKEQIELNSNNSDAEFEAQIQLKQSQIEKLTHDLNLATDTIKELESCHSNLVRQLDEKHCKEICLKNEEISSLKLNHTNDLLKSEENLSSLVAKHNLELENAHTNLLVASSQSNELENLVSLKQKIIEDLSSQLNELKALIEVQRVNYEQQIDAVSLNAKDKDVKLNFLKNELSNMKLKQSFIENKQAAQQQETFLISSANESFNESNEMYGSLTPSNKCSHLEAQLKFCHEKCKLVVDKLMQLKQQNESLNIQIKSIRTKMVV